MGVTSLRYRKATPADIPLLMELRKKQLMDEGSVPTCNMDQELRLFWETKFQDGSLVQFLVEDQGQVVATGGILFYLFPPSFANKSGNQGYVMSMYTQDDHRGQGIATALLQRITQEARERNVHALWLGASPMGRPVYERYGFTQAHDLLEMDLNQEEA